MRYTPFDVEIRDVSERHLASLRDVAEGWYVEYKSEVPKPRDLAKSLSAFANRSGGWLFLGIQEDSSDNTAASFPGIPDAEVTSTLQRVRDAAKDLLQPTVEFSHRILAGPMDAISFPVGRSIVIVRIPESATTPHVHNDGRVYVRTGDSSSPVPATDRTTLDLLHRKAEERLSLLDNLIDRRPAVSQAEANTTFLHLSLLSDPFRVLGHWYSGSFMDFSAAMEDSPLPFDNMFASQDGFVARQVRNNDRGSRLFTWEFSRRCDSFITLPLNEMPVFLAHEDGSIVDFGGWSQYEHGERFASLLADRGLQESRVLNLDILASVLIRVVARHRSLTGFAGVRGPFYLKAQIENAWRAIPFWDTDDYIDHIESFDFPVVQDSDLTAPFGDWPDGFVTAAEMGVEPHDDTHERDFSAVSLWVAIMQALGIPSEVVRNAAKDAADVAIREADRHLRRVADQTD